MNNKYFAMHTHHNHIHQLVGTHLRTVISIAVLMLCISTHATNETDSRQRLFTTGEKDAIPYRIPAIATCSNGDLIAAADYRYCGSDIGYGAVDLVYRISRDNGKTWSEEKILADGQGNEADIKWDYAFGDCALVADKKSSEVLATCAAGKTVYFQATRNNPNRIAIFRSYDNGKTWDKGHEITEQIYRLFDQRKAGPIQSLFFTSGKIHQSRHIKVGKYYRLYVGLCTLSGNFVLYSDDFGRQWHVLGDINTSPCRDGDEVKCEELPDGSLILSSRHNGRLFNVFTFSNLKKAEGSWGQRAKAAAFTGIENECNGEILVVPAIRKADSKKTFVAIQSIPFGPQRTRIGFFYKDLGKKHLTSQQLADGWQRGMMLATGLGAYSTMTLQKDGRIGFLWESGPTIYNIDYQSLKLEDITNGQYQLKGKF